MHVLCSLHAEELYFSNIFSFFFHFPDPEQTYISQYQTHTIQHLDFKTSFNEEEKKHLWIGHHQKFHNILAVSCTIDRTMKLIQMSAENYQARL